MKLSDFGSNAFSQFGEDGMIAEALRRVGEGGRTCVEFGAADGLSCSNTARLWKQGWRAVLIEADLGLYESLVETTVNHPDATPVKMTVAPSGPNSIDALLMCLEITSVDFMSIDVDGDDYAIWEAMKIRPRIVCIEYNQSVPPHVELRQAHSGDCFGASALSVCLLAQSKGYELVGLTEANLIFVDRPLAGAFDDLELELGHLFDFSALTYVVTDELGHPAIVGSPPWGWREENYLREVVGEVTRLPIFPSGSSRPTSGSTERCA